MSTIFRYKKAFRLHGETGECPNTTTDTEVIDISIFFVCPFPTSEKAKPIMDWQIERLVSLDILSKNSTNHCIVFSTSHTSQGWIRIPISDISKTWFEIIPQNYHFFF